MFKPGHKKLGGRRKGSTNKATADIKAMICAALDKAGGEEYLYQQSQVNPGPFMTLIGKVLPMQLTGEGGGPVIVATGVHRGDQG